MKQYFPDVVFNQKNYSEAHSTERRTYKTDNSYYRPVFIENETKYKCINCDKTYKLKRTVKRHVDYECGKDKSFQCKFCSFRAHRRDVYYKHEQKCASKNRKHSLN